MLDVQPRTPEGNLVRVVAFQSPKFTQKFQSQSVREGEDGPIFNNHHSPPEPADILYPGLETQCSYRIGAPLQGHYHSTFGYVFMGQNGALHTLIPTCKRESGGELLTPRDTVYQRTVTVRVQPADKEVSPELAKALTDMGYTPVLEAPKA